MLTTTLMEKANNLAEDHERYVGEFVARGHQELYKILAAVYEIILAIDQSSDKEYMIKMFRKELREKFCFRTTAKTSLIAIVIRYVTRASTKTVSIYKRVLAAAFDAKIASEGLSDYITKSGGVDKCGKAISNESSKTEAKARATALKNAASNRLELKSAIGTVKLSNTKVGLTPNAADVSFIHILCKKNQSTGELEIASLIYPCSDIEEIALSVHVLCCRAAALIDDSGKFQLFCKQNGLNMDNVHRWMSVNGIAGKFEAQIELNNIFENSNHDKKKRRKLATKNIT